MKKDIFITPGLCRIREQIADAARKTNEKNTVQNGETAVPNDSAPQQPVSALAALPPETRQAWLSRRDEFLRYRKEMRIRLHELAAECTRRNEAAEKDSSEIREAGQQLAALLEQLEHQPEPDEFSPDFQVRLSDVCRELDHMRLELIPLQNRLSAENRTAGSSGNASPVNLFAELDSVSFGQLFRIGAALSLPLILTLFFCALLLCIVIALTFRVGL